METKGTNSVTSNGRQSGRSANYDEEYGDDAQCGDKLANEEAQAENSWEVKEENIESHERNRDALVESAIILHSAQEELEREGQKLGHFLAYGDDAEFERDDTSDGVNNEELVDAPQPSKRNNRFQPAPSQTSLYWSPKNHVSHSPLPPPVVVSIAARSLMPTPSYGGSGQYRIVEPQLQLPQYYPYIAPSGEILRGSIRPVVRMDAIPDMLPDPSCLVPGSAFNTKCQESFMYYQELARVRAALERSELGGSSGGAGDDASEGGSTGASGSRRRRRRSGTD